MKTIPDSFSDCRSQFDAYTRKNPTRSILIAAGAGLAAGLALYAIGASHPTSRLERLVGELQGRLQNVGNGDGFVHRSVDRVRGLFS